MEDTVQAEEELQPASAQDGQHRPLAPAPLRRDQEGAACPQVRIHTGDCQDSDIDLSVKITVTIFEILRVK